MKKFGVWLLVLVMCVSILPANLFAAPAPLEAGETLAEYQAERAQSGLRLWYDEPTTVGARSGSTSDNGDWQNNCLPLGNGYMGAMLAGQVQAEEIQFNEKTLWTGGPSASRPNYNGGNKTGDLSATLKTIQNYLLEGNTSAASNLRNQLTGVSAGYGAYQNFGWVTINHKFDGESFAADSVSDYARDLDMETGTGSASFAYKGVGYVRQYFMSYPDNVMAIYQTATKSGALNMDIGGESAQSGATVTADGDTVTIKGALADNGLRYEAQIKVIPTGGSMAATGDKITVTGADSVVILMSAATDYENTYPTYRSGVDPAQVVSANIAAAAAKGYDDLYASHLADYQELFGRVELDFGEAASGKTTDVLLAEYKAGATNRELEILLFQYGRYMLIASSREGTLPANLQGVWNETNSPPWSSDYHINVNLQMNYWPVYNTNLVECAIPMIEYVDSWREPGRETAKIYMGIESTEENPENGFTAHTQNTPFGWTCPGWSFDWGWSPAAVPWMLQNVWEHYEYTGDVDYMRGTIYPMLKEQAKLWQQYLLYNPEDGLYYSAPAYSPEHGPLTMGNTYEHVLVRQLLADAITASEVLGVDEELRAEWQALYGKIRGEEIGDEGQLKEWFEETTIGSMGGERGHRHLSHLLGLYPGDSVSVETPELMDAAVKSLTVRGDNATGWGVGQRINAWARTQDGEAAHRLIRAQMNSAIHNNLFDTHPPFQIDGNFGYTSGVAEMLVQSNLGYIQPLPAIPKVWGQGTVKGLVARGNFELAMEWSDKYLDKMTVLSNNGGECAVKYVTITENEEFTLTCEGSEVAYTLVDGLLTFDTEQGKSYLLTLSGEKPVDPPDPVDGPAALGAVRTEDGAAVMWHTVEGDEVTYDLYRKVDSDPYEKLTAEPVAAARYTDTGAPVGDVWYKVVAHTDGITTLDSPQTKLVQSALGMVDDRDERIQWQDNWATWSDSSGHYQGTIKFIEATTGGEWISMAFVGTGIRIITPKNPNFGIMDIYVDGAKVDTVSLYAASSLKQQTIYENKALAAGPHLVSLVATGTKEAASTKTKIEFDAFEVFNDAVAPVESIAVGTATGAEVIATAGGNLQMTAVVLPEDADNREIIWSASGAGASISTDGLLTAGEESGSVTVTATAADGSGVAGSKTITVALGGAVSEEAITDNKALAQGTNYITSPGGTAWAEYAESKHYNGSIHYVQGDNATGAQINFTFTGTGIDVVTPTNNTFGSFEVTLDGELVETVALNGDLSASDNAGKAQQVVYSNKALANGQHTIELKLVERDGKTKAEFDYFKVYTTAALPDKSALEAAINKAFTALQNPQDYEQDANWDVLTTQHAAALAVFNNLEADNALIESALTELEAAYKALTPAGGSIKEPAPWDAVPSSNQIKYQKDELAAFCHFGMNTFTGVEWGSGNESPSQFNLQQDFDADNYVKTLVDAGFKKLIITAKHHDGFCIWPSAYTEHSVKNSPYKNGEGDILAEISAACTKYDMDMGLYMSPWDANAESYGYYDEDGSPCGPEDDVLDYNDYYVNQIIEIASNPKYGNNGRFVEWWMDGAKGSGADAQEYDFQRWFDTIQQYQGKAAGYDDDCLLFGAGASTTVRWISNESGFAHSTTWSKSYVDYTRNAIDSNSRSVSGTNYSIGYPQLPSPNPDNWQMQWTVPEADARITSGWFWGNNKKAPKTLKDLGDMYFRSVGHGATLLLNIPPNNQGTLDAAITERTLELGQAISDTFADNLATAQGVTAAASEVRGNSELFAAAKAVDGLYDTYWAMEDGSTTGALTIDLGARRQFDVVSIEEYITLGQRVAAFTVEYKDGDGDWKLFGEGTTIGAKRLLRSTPVRADKLRLTITESYAVPLISEVGVYKAAEDFSLAGTLPPEGIDFIDDRAFTKGSGWTQEAIGLENTSMYSSTAGAYAETTFTGSKFWFVSNIDPNHGIARILVDGVEVAKADTYSASRSLSQIVYASDDLTHGQHTVRIEVTGTCNAASNGNAVAVDGIYYLNNNGAGMFEFDPVNYAVTAGEDATLTVKRVGGAAGEVSVTVSDNPGGAVQGANYVNTIQTITFADGETEKTFSIGTFVHPDQAQPLNFYVEAHTPTGGAILGFHPEAEVIINLPKSGLQTLYDQAAALFEAHYTAESWAPLPPAMEAAEAVLEDESATGAAIKAAIDALQTALDGLVERGAYTEEDAFAFPARNGDSALLEAEFFTLIPRVPGEEPNSTNENVRISTDPDASNGKKVSWMEPGNRIELPFYAAKAGTYTLKMRYQSGRNPGVNENRMVWSGTNVEAGMATVPGQGTNPPFTTMEFDIVITAPGAGLLVFTPDEQAGPNIDKFDVVAKELAMETFTITASAGAGGGISPNGAVAVTEGEDKTFAVTPEAGYAIEDVLVNGASVGAVESYTFTNVRADATIEAVFAFAHYAADNPFVLPAAGEAAKTAEAEHFVLTMRVPGEDPDSTNQNVRISEDSNASNGKKVSWMEPGNKISLYFNAPAAGTYTLTMRYQSGRNPGVNENRMVWSGENVVAGMATVPGQGTNPPLTTMQFDIEIPAAGPGLLEFIPDEQAGPNVDKFDFVRKQDPVDKTALEELVTEIEKLGLNETSYTAASWTTFAAAMEEAKAVLEKTDPTGAEVEAAYNELLAAWQGLVVKAESMLPILELFVEAFDKLEPDSFTAESWSPFAQAMETAKALIAQGEAADNDEVIAALEVLLEAQDKLVWETTGGLQSLITEAEAMLAQPEKYFSASVENLTKAVAAAKKFLDDTPPEDLTIEKVNAEAIKLVEAISRMFEKGDIARLQILVDYAKRLDSKHYTETSWNAFVAVLAEAETAVKENDLLPDEVTDLYDRLTAAIGSLKAKANKTGLEAAITVAQSIVDSADKYVVGSIQGLAEALEAAKTVYNDVDASQDAVEAAQNDLMARAMKARKPANKAALKSALGYSSRLSGSMGQAGAEDLEAAMAMARQVANDPDATQNDVDQAKAAMDAALGQQPQAPATTMPGGDKAAAIPVLPAPGSQAEDGEAAMTPAQPEGPPAGEAQAPRQDEAVDMAITPMAPPADGGNPLFVVLIGLAALCGVALVALRLRNRKR